jgi:orotidine-5'-phosphate decarboxylase
MIPSEKIIVALDFSEKEEVASFLQIMKGHKMWVKVGMELFYSLGPSIIHEAKDLGFNIFLDLKLHDIPNTVGQAMKSLTNLPVDMVNVHASGGSEMMKRASEAIQTSSRRPLLIAVTQLTSTTLQQMNVEQRIPGDIVESVSHLAKLAKESGCDGVVSSPHEVQAIKLICGSRFLTVTPGIRPLDSDSQDQKRITTPKEALLLGTDFLVIGRPITKAKDPKLALEAILKGN